MLNRNPSNSSNVINSYRKRRQQKGPFLVYGAIALVIIGGIMLIIWLTGPGQPFSGLFPTETPTPTLTFTPPNTSAPTVTPTTTLTPSPTVSPTPSEPFPYTIQEGDLLQTLAERFNLGADGVGLIYDLNQSVRDSGGVIYVGQTILIPIPGTTRATSTPIPSNLGRGTLIEYSVLPGDTLAGIAASFNSIEQNIIDENPDVITNANALQVGQVLQIPVNLVTATATVAGGQPTAAATTAAGTSSVSEPAACEFEENAGFVTQLQTLINSERTSNSLSALTLNPQLSAAAKTHAADMLCYNYLSHTGFDSSTPETRVAAQGFTASVVVEDIYASKTGTSQAALDWWLSDPAHRADILNADTTAFGIAYVTSADSMLGGYFVVVSAKP